MGRPAALGEKLDVLYVIQW